MRLNNDEICKRFAQNDVGHQNSTKTITSRRAGNGDGLLFSYGALIGHHDSMTGEISVMESWRGYSVTTSCHLTCLKKNIERLGYSFETISSGRPRHNVYGTVPEIKADGVESLRALAAE